MSKDKRLTLIRDDSSLDIKYLDRPIVLDAPGLTDDIDELSEEAFKNALQNRLELMKARVNLWFKEIIEKVGDYKE
jgi:hypothetical protein